MFKLPYERDGAHTAKGKPRSDTLSRVHFGTTIGSGNIVVKDAVIRDQRKKDFNIP